MPTAGVFTTSANTFADTSQINFGDSTVFGALVDGAVLSLTNSNATLLYRITGVTSLWEDTSTVTVIFVGKKGPAGSWSGDYQITAWPGTSFAASGLAGVVSESNGGAGSINGVLFADGSGTVSTATGTPSADTVLTGDKSWTAAALVTVDAGWTANAGAGDKTVSVPNYTSPASWLDLSSDGSNFSPYAWTAQKTLSDQVQALTAKVQALEAALAARRLPDN
jgi:hypothetical protein